MKHQIGYSPMAAATLTAMRESAPGAPQAALYSSVAEIITKVIAEPELTFLPQHRLSDDLAGVLRVKKGRLRIFFIASSARSAVAILFIGTRKDGDKRDAYAEFARHLKRGAFDQQFSDLGVKKPG